MTTITKHYRTQLNTELAEITDQIDSVRRRFTSYQSEVTDVIDGRKINSLLHDAAEALDDVRKLLDA